MQLKNDVEGINLLRELIVNFYKKNGDRNVSIFLHSKNEEWKSDSLCYLLDRKYVIRYTLGPDDRGYGTYVGGIELAIGPHYFSAADFWDYKNFERFRMSTEPFEIEMNLSLIDEFLGYPIRRTPPN
ncbi:MAG: hypothetical protein V4614_17575 [Pseudomonadota bacterium]